MSRIAEASISSVPQEKRRPNRKRWPGRSSIISMAGLAVVLGGWELLVHGTGIPSYVLPSIEDVVRSLADGLLVPVTDRSGYYLPLWSTLSNSAIGVRTLPLPARPTEPAPACLAIWRAFLFTLS